MKVMNIIIEARKNMIELVMKPVVSENRVMRKYPRSGAKRPLMAVSVT